MQAKIQQLQENEVAPKIIEHYASEITYPLHIDTPLQEDWQRFVYVFWNKDNDLKKIGITTNPWLRLSQIRTQSGCNVLMAMFIELEIGYDEHAKVVEKFLHKYYIDKRSSGEWFRLSNQDLCDIEYLFCGHIEGWHYFGSIEDGARRGEMCNLQAEFFAHQIKD